MPKKLKPQEKEIAELKEKNQRLQQQLAKSQHRCSQKEQELQKTQTELEAIREGYSDSERFLRLAIDNIPGAIFWKDNQSVYLGCNQYFATLTGLDSPVGIVGKTDYDLPWKREETEFFRECDRRVMDSDTPELGIIEPQQQADGSSYWLEKNKIPLHDFQGNVIGILGTFADISDRIKAEKALQQLNVNIHQQKQTKLKLQEQEQFLRSVYDGIAHPIFVIDVTEEGNFYYLGCNAAYEKATKTKQEDIIGKTPQDSMGKIAGAEICDRFNQCIEKREPLTIEECLVLNNQETWWQTTFTPLYDFNKRIYRIVGTTFNISDLKASQQALQESEAKYQQILDSINDMVLVKREKSRIVWANKSFRDYYGMSNKELQSLIDASFNDPDYTQQYIRDDAYVFETGQLLEVEEPVTRYDGEVRQFNTIKSAIHNEEGEIILTVGVYRDITDRKTAEVTLQESEAFNRRLFAEFPIGLALCRMDGQLIDVNVTYAEIIGYTIAETLELTYWEVTPIKYTDREAEQLQNLQTNGRYGPYEKEYIHKDGHLVPVVLSGLIIEKDGESFIWSSVEDIRDRKLQEEALRESSELIYQQAQREKLLNQLTSQIRNSLDLKQILETTVQEIQRFIEVDRCHFAWYVEEGEKAYWDVVVEVQKENLSSFIGRYSISTFGALSQMLLQRETVRINDVSQIEDREVREFVMTLGNQSMLVLPVWDNTGERYGIIACIQHQEVRSWHDDEIELLEAVAAQLAIAINQANLLTQSQARTQELENLLERLQRTQTQLIQSEKMSSLGQMVAGVAHEINNPVNFIHGNLVHANEYTEDLLGLLDLYQKYYPQPHPDICEEIEAIDLDFLKADLQKLLRSMRVGTDRISGIVRSLRTFSRLDESEVKDVNLHDGIDSTLMILQTRLRSQDWRPEIKIIKDYGEFPLVKCYAGQLNQVFMNIISNAIDALEERDRQRTLEQMQAHPSQIDIQTQKKDNNIIIRICDNGMGMSETTRSKLFDPFFTTKSIGKGTGLGLSISYQIVTEKHNGKLSCTSKSGETAFLIEIPV